MPRLLDLWRQPGVLGQDSSPSKPQMRRRLATFHWETRSRLSEEGGRITGSVFVVSRLSPDGVLAIIHAVGMVDAYAGLVEWGVLFARAAGANIVQITTNKGLDGALAPLGLSRVRPW